ncbi:MAG: Hsp20 family protein [Fischerella sp.]|nr:Hsp20 family protein [Fischerella sp.]
MKGDKFPFFISGEQRYDSKAKGRGCLHSGFYYSKFEHQIRLPVPIQPEGVQTEFQNDVLTLVLAKTDFARKLALAIVPSCA